MLINFVNYYTRLVYEIWGEGHSGFEYSGDHDEKKEKAEEVAAAVVILLADGMKSRQEIQLALKSDFGKTAIDDGIKLSEEKEEIIRVPKEELPKEDRKKAYYRLPPKDYSQIPGTDSYEEVEDDLPVSQLLIGDGKQEDKKDELPASPLCTSPISSDTNLVN